MVDLFGGVGGKDGDAQRTTGGGAGVVTHMRDGDALFKQSRAQMLQVDARTDAEAEDGDRAVGQFPAEPAQTVAGQAHIVPQGLTQLRGGAGNLQGAGRCRGNGEGRGTGANADAGIAVEVFDPFGRSADHAAVPAQGLTEGGRCVTMVILNLVMIRCAAAMLAEDAGGVGIVEKDDAIVFLGQGEVIRQRGNFPGDGEDSVADDQRSFIGEQLAAQGFCQRIG